MGYGWDVAERFEVVHDVPHWKTSLEVVRPHWAHRKDERRPSKILMCGEQFHGGMSISEAERIRDALDKAIALAKTLKLEKPKKEQTAP